MKVLTAVVIGFGARGSVYAQYALSHPEDLKIVAVANKSKNRLESARERHNLTDDQLFSDWREMQDKPRLADFAIISTQDNFHLEPALAMIEKGYHLLLEKPMATNARDCRRILEAAEKKGVKVLVCHVLRFTPFWVKIKEIVDSGALGEIQSIVHIENVGIFHHSHSYVRGNWRNTAESSPMILAKSSHDLDLIQWLIGKKCKKVQSFGSLSYFNAANRPAGAPDRCLDGCPAEDTCIFHAKKLYHDNEKFAFRAHAAGTVGTATNEEVMKAISEGPYGRCVFACDNDVVDHQVVNLEYEGGVTASFTMNAFNAGGRNIRIYGTKGELIGDMKNRSIRIYDFAKRAYTELSTELPDSVGVKSHGGGDTGIMESFLKYLRGEYPGPGVCDLRTSYENHLAAFAAEEARLTGTVISMEEFEKNL